MTTNQLEFQRLVEDHRHNTITEGQTDRNLNIKEKEYRANTILGGINAGANIIKAISRPFTTLLGGK